MLLTHLAVMIKTDPSCLHLSGQSYGGKLPSPVPRGLIDLERVSPQPNSGIFPLAVGVILRTHCSVPVFICLFFYTHVQFFIRAQIDGVLTGIL